MPRARRWVRISSWMGLTILMVTMHTSCVVGYLGKQGVAQLRVLANRVPVSEALPTLPLEQQGRLRLIQDAKGFGAQVLGLPTEGVYETYSGAHPDPIYNVSACPKDRLEPHLWHFPVMGALPYIGYYDKADAEQEKKRLEAEGYDVMMYGAGAFSSLGWFQDPIVPSMLRYREVALVNTTLHESAHRYLFFKRAVDFNESFASFVGDQGAISYYAWKYGHDHALTLQARGERQDASVFGPFVADVVTRAQALYARTDLSREQKLASREGLFAQVQLEYTRLPLKTTVYDGFKTRKLDNAVLLSYRRYGSGQEMFDRLLERCDGDLKAAMGVVKGLEPDREDRRAGQTPFQALRVWLDTNQACVGHVDRT